MNTHLPGSPSLSPDDLRQQNNLEFLEEITERLAATSDLDGILLIVRRAARALTGSDGATFVLREDQFCHYVDEDAVGPLWKGRRFPLTTCISGWSMIQRQVAVIPDIYVDARIPHEAYRPTFVKSLVMVPIRQANPLGAIGNYWAAPHMASEAEVALLQGLAEATGKALERLQENTVSA